MWKLLTGLIQDANREIPGASGVEKRAWVEERVLGLVEVVDHLIPVIGKWADLPAVDGFEKYLVRIAIERAYAALKLPE